MHSTLLRCMYEAARVVPQWKQMVRLLQSYEVFQIHKIFNETQVVNTNTPSVHNPLEQNSASGWWWYIPQVYVFVDWPKWRFRSECNTSTTCTYMDVSFLLKAEPCAVKKCVSWLFQWMKKHCLCKLHTNRFQIWQWNGDGDDDGDPVYGDGNDSDYDDNVVMMVVMVMWWWWWCDMQMCVWCVHRNLGSRCPTGAAPLPLCGNLLQQLLFPVTPGRGILPM